MSSFRPLLFLSSSFSRFSSSSSSSSFPSFQYLSLQPHHRHSDNHVLLLSFKREELHNAFNADMIREITSAFQFIDRQLDDQSSILKHPRCVVLTGAGKSFSAGADLNWMREMADYTFEQNMEDAQRLYDMIHSIRTCKIPVIARVNGPALGGGAGIVAASDIAISVSSAKFGFTEVKLGLLPAVISPFVIAKIGATNASRYFLTGEVMPAQTAQAIQLVHAVADNEQEMDAEVDKVVSNICSSSPAAVRASKNLVLKFSRPEDHQKEKDFVTGEIARIRVSSLGQDGLRSFLSKAKPSWVVSK